MKRNKILYILLPLTMVGLVSCGSTSDCGSEDTSSDVPSDVQHTHTLGKDGKCTECDYVSDKTCFVTEANYIKALDGTYFNNVTLVMASALAGNNTEYICGDYRAIDDFDSFADLKNSIIYDFNSETGKFEYDTHRHPAEGNTALLTNLGIAYSALEFDSTKECYKVSNYNCEYAHMVLDFVELYFANNKLVKMYGEISKQPFLLELKNYGSTSFPFDIADAIANATLKNIEE